MSTDYPIKTCGRCGGDGKYGMHWSYGTTCMQCGGTGKVLGGTIAADAKPIDRAEVGEIYYQRGIYYKVVAYRWYDPNKAGNDESFNQQLKLVRLVDGKTYRTWRTYRDENGRLVTPAPEQITGTWL